MNLLERVAEGALELVDFDSDAMRRAIAVLHGYSDLGIGLTDASVVVTADRRGTAEILTLDQRHFRALRTRSGRPFRLLPADA